VIVEDGIDLPTLHFVAGNEGDAKLLECFFFLSSFVCLFWTVGISAYGLV